MGIIHYPNRNGSINTVSIEGGDKSIFSATPSRINRGRMINATLLSESYPEITSIQTLVR